MRNKEFCLRGLRAYSKHTGKSGKTDQTLQLQRTTHPPDFELIFRGLNHLPQQTNSRMVGVVRRRCFYNAGLIAWGHALQANSI